MSLIHEQLSKRFYQWELRGRGWHVYPEPVHPEPPFVPFDNQFSPPTTFGDDGKRSTTLSSFVRRLNQKINNPTPPVIPENEPEPQPETLIRDSLVELQTSLPADLNIGKEAFEHLLSNLSLCREPIAFELLGLPNRVTTQFAAHPEDAPLIRRQLQSYFPETVFQANKDTLLNAWDSCEGEHAWAVEFGLAREFMFPLADGKLDPFIGIVGALAELRQNELGLFQVLFQSAQNSWPESIMRSVAHNDGKPFFVNKPELTRAAENKITHPLYAAVVRIAVKSESFERTLQISSDLAGSLRVFAHPQGNELIPLENSNYGFEEHLEDVVRRQSRRSGMLLNSDELIGFVHLPSGAVRAPAFQRETNRTKAAPAIARIGSGVLLGNNVHAGETVAVRLSPDRRMRHMHVVGASGTGKSTLLFNLISQDIQNGDGVAILDPAGDLIDRILGSIPENRIDDVVLVDPADEGYSVAFNILSAHSDLERNLLASDLVSVFQRLSTSWGDQMNSVISNAILAFLESSEGGTIADLRRFLIEPGFRTEFLKTVQDSEVIYYWQKGFPHLGGNKSIGPILTRLETFLGKKPIRYMVSQRENKLDFANIMDTGKIFLAKLSQGLLGKENSFLLGSLLVSKFQQIAMSRQAQQIAARKDFYVYADEFQNFITPSMAEILTGTRKYRMGLILAHQELRQLERDREVASGVLSCHTRVTFRVGDEDARKLSEGFASFESRDVQNLETGQALCRIERSDYDFNLSIPYPVNTNEAQCAERKNDVITASRKKYGTPRAEVEAMLRPTPSIEPPAKITSPPLAPLLPTPVVPKVPEPPKISEVPKEEIKKHKPIQSREVGRGGAAHLLMQKRIKRVAEALGFVSTMEKEIAEGKGVDLFLVRDGQTIACEIANTNTINKEIANIEKCIKEGCSKVAMISWDTEHLKKIAAAVVGCFNSEVAERIGYYQPNEFIAYLRRLTPPTQLAPEAPEVRAGRRVTRKIIKLSPEEQKKREDLLHQAAAKAMRRKPE